MIRIGQLLLVLAAGGLWLASRMTWVEVSSSDGLGQPKAMALTGAGWSTALVPLAVMLVAAALASIVGPTWQRRLLAVVVAGMSAVIGYLAISVLVIRDIAVRAALLAEVPLADFRTAERFYGGAVITLIGAVATLAGAVLFIRAPAKVGSDTKYSAPARRREATRQQDSGTETSERMIWDALDEGLDPTNPDIEGR